MISIHFEKHRNDFWIDTFILFSTISHGLEFYKRVMYKQKLTPFSLNKQKN